jgi:hypothetical protein
MRDVATLVFMFVATAAIVYSNYRLTLIEASLQSIKNSGEHQAPMAENKTPAVQTASFNDCVLDHIKDATAVPAAYAVKEACIEKAADFLPQRLVDALDASASYAVN